MLLKLDPSRVTGVFEKKEIQPNLRLLRLIAPDAREFAIVGDASTTYDAIAAEIGVELTQVQGFKARFIASPRLSEIVEALKAFTGRYVFLTTMGAVSDETGRTLPLAETLRAVTHAGDFVVFSMEDAYLIEGVMGGFVTSGPSHGRTAAGLLLRHLNGASLKDLPPVQDSPNVYMFDQGQLNRAGLGLPEPIARRAQLFNIQPTFYEANRALILTALYTLGAAAVLALLLVYWANLQKNRKLAENAKTLRESEDRFRRLSELSVEGLIINRKGMVLDSNRSVEEMFGYSHDEFKTVTPATVIAPEYMSVVMDHIQKDQEDPYEVVGVKKDGSRFPIEIRAKMIDIEGDPVRVSCIRDITERKKTERRRETDARRLRRLLELNRDAVRLDESELLKRALDIAVDVTASKIGYLHLVNADQKSLTLSTWNDEALKGCTAPYDTHYPVEHAGVWADALRLKQPVVHNDYPTLETKNGYPDGHFPVLRHMSAPVMDGDRVRLIVGVGNKDEPYDDIDIDELQRVADEIQKFVERRRVELALRERTSELVRAKEIAERAKEDAERAQEETEKASRAKSEFLSSMSHELRTPLNAILGFAQVLDVNPKEPLSPEQKLAVHQITKGGKHLLSLINDVLDLARIDAGRMDLSIEDVPMGPLFDECRALIDAMAAPRAIAVRFASPAVGRVRADYTRIKQVLLNLLSNAVKYNHDGGRVDVVCELLDGGMARVRVTDTGPGIAEDKQAEMFQPFSRLGAESGTIEGTGIGLVIARQLIEAMGGTIDFTSRPGKGSSFWFDIPAVDRDGGAAAPSPLDAAADDTPLGHGVAGRIVYVEDNPANIALMQSILRHIDGLELTAVHTAELGLEVIRTERPDLVLMDINLPGMSGIEALARMREDETMKDIPTIAISAAAMPSEVQAGLDAGFLAYLTKPFNVAEMLGVIKDILAGNR
ncbi:MAG: GAF domain-containing protein [Alphaproteobacteria bacterium]|nr:GAF domain-containing protein [Alphaproteobacteria bacterium]